MRIVIADDYLVVLMGLRELFAGEGLAYEVVGEAHTGGELLALMATTPCDLIVTDFSMPDPLGSVDGLALLALLRERHPEVPVIVLTMVGHPPLIHDMLAHGAMAVISKTEVATELLHAIWAATHECNYLGTRLRSHATGTFPRTWDRLSPREQDVVRWLGQGFTVTQIAQRTQRSVKTISHQKLKAMHKLGLRDQRQLHDYVLAMGMLS